MTPDFSKQSLIVTQGIPGSGKSTWACEMVKFFAFKKSYPTVVRVNRDAIRQTLGFRWDQRYEPLVTASRNAMISIALAKGMTVINDDTNIDATRLGALRDIAEEHDVPFVLNSDFLDVSVEECIKRDAERAISVGKDVVEDFYNRYWETQPKPANEGPMPAILCDLDGTLALFGKKNPYEREWSQDICNPGVLQCLRAMSLTHTIILVSGRDDKFRRPTEEWLRANAIPYHFLFMRPRDDKRKDYLFKRELYMEQIQGRYHVDFVLDDRPSVVRRWRAELGLTVFQVAPSIEF